MKSNYYVIGRADTMMKAVVSPDYVDGERLTKVVRYKTSLIQGYYYESEEEQQGHIKAMVEAGWQHSQYRVDVSGSVWNAKYVLYSEFGKESYT